MDNLMDRFLGTVWGAAIYARFVVPHYHSFVRFNGGLEQRIELPDCELDKEFVADPFLFAWHGNIWLFFEGMYKGRGDRGVSKGVIGCMCYGEDGWKYKGISLEKSYHLSYPLVFENEGNVYMIPESAQAGEVALYEAVDFPLKWRKVAVLIKGRYVDSVIFHKDGLWYMVTAPEDGRSRAELWCSNSLIGGWRKHSDWDKVSSLPSLRRNGGAIYYDDRYVYRIAQDCDGGYGKRLHRIPIEKISPSSYCEGSPELLSDAISWPQPKMHHTYNCIMSDEIMVEVVDRHYNTIRKSLSFLVAAGWYFIDGLRFLFRKLLKKDSTDDI